VICDFEGLIGLVYRLMVRAIPFVDLSNTTAHVLLDYPALCGMKVTMICKQFQPHRLCNRYLAVARPKAVLTAGPECQEDSRR
jgi:hypothetical protein